MARPLLLVLAWMTAFCLTTGARGQSTVVGVPPLPNGDFTKGEVGGVPTDWLVPTEGLKASIADGVEGEGGRRVILKPAGTQMGNFMRSVDATPYRGRDVVLKFRLSVSGNAGARAQPWVRVDRPNEGRGWFDNSGDRPVTMGDKETTTVLPGHIDDDAVSLNVGVLVFGGATVTLRSVSLEEGKPPDLNVKPSPLTDRALANLSAFAQMYGQVKYFHPSETAFRADWTAIAMVGVQQVEKAADAAALAAALRDAFASVGVGIQVWPDTEPAPAAAKPPTEGRVIGWSHQGVNFGPEFAARAGSPNLYSSSRIKEAVDTDKRKLPAPGTTATGSAGGVSWRIPVILPLDARGFTAGPDDPPKDRVADPRTSQGFAPTGDDRATRLADVVIAWSLLANFYPYFDTVKTDWPATLNRSLTRAATDPDANAFTRTLRMLVADLHDGHGSVTNVKLHPQTGLPCGWRFIGQTPELIVTSGGGGEQDAASLKPGDRILSVDGRAIADLLTDWRTQTSAATEQWARSTIARSLLFDAPQTDPSVIEIERDGKMLTLQVPLVPFAQFSTDDPKRPDQGTVVARIDGREGASAEIRYFNLNGAKEPEFAALQKDFADCGGIVFDLRGYPDSAATTVLRHLAAEPLRSAKWITPSVTMPGGVNGSGWTWVERGRWTLPPEEPRLGGDKQPVVFLADGRAISYAESVMGIVEAYKLADIVGGPTAGTNGNINPFTLPGGYYIPWTGMRVIKHDGSTHHGVGIAPTVPCEPTRQGLAAGRDEVLERGIEVIKSKAAKPTK